MTYEARVLVLARNAPSIGAIIGGKVVDGLGKTFRLGESDPAVHGSQWLGHEGDLVRYAYLKTTASETSLSSIFKAPAVPSHKVIRTGEFSNTVTDPVGNKTTFFNIMLVDQFKTTFERFRRDDLAFKRSRMRRAWDVAARAANSMGGSPRQYIAAAMRAVACAWKCYDARVPFKTAIESIKNAFKGV